MEHLKFWIEVVVIMLVLLNGLGWSHGCVDEEREALLQLKTFFNYLDWPVKAKANSSDCCEWKMVECNVTTGRITKLSLFNGVTETKLWHLNASYFSPFEQLTSLDLSYNQLAGCAENQGFEILWSRLRKLEVLKLGRNEFTDNIIPSLSGFSSLKSLYLWYNDMGTSLDTKGFESLWRLSNLELLDLSYNRFNNNILSSLHGLSSLKDLNLWRNKLSGTINMQDLNSLVNLKNLDMSYNEITGFNSLKGDLEFLDLSNNNLSGHVFASLNGLSHLKSLNLSYNLLTGSIHLKELSGLRNLEDLQLNNNYIEEIVGPEDKTTLNKLKMLGLASLKTDGKGTLKSLGALSTLKTINLGENILNESNIFQELFNLSSLEELFLDGSSLHKEFLQNHVASFTSLKVLHLSSCGFKGTLPDRGWCDLKNLEEFYLGYNELEGTLPPCLGNLSSIRILDLSHNQFTGNIASTAIPNLKSIESLSLQSNHFQVSLKLFASHSNLKVFLIDDGNEFIDEAVSQPWTPKFQLEELSVSNFILRNSNTNFLNFLYHQFELRYLYLSKGKFTGAFPSWLFENNTRLEDIYLLDNSFVGRFQWPSRPNPNMSFIVISHNKLRGHIPSNISFLFPNLWGLNLSENYFEGTLPGSLGELKLLDVLDLSNNQFSGELEEHQFAQSSIWILKLSNNNLTGCIPTTLFHMYNLGFLQLDGNNFVGEIADLPLLNDLVVLDMSHNSLSGKLPRWMGNMSKLEAVVLSYNQFRGPIPSEFCKLYELQLLDLSGNKLSGSIPLCFSQLINLEHLLLRRNKLRGRMTQSFFNMTSLVTLDLGENNFIGTIPKWIGNLSNLGILILRGNEFRGDISIHICNLSRLNILDLSSNSLSGRLPPCLSNFSFTMGFNFSHNFQIFFQYNSGQWNVMSSILTGVVEFTTKRNFLNYTGYILDHMYGIDLSCNQFFGEIPPEFGNLSNLRALNFSHNSLSGSIPTSFSKLKQLESLDLSYNNLHGQIPPQLIEISTLAVFSVAHNNLSGSVPDFKAQFATFSISSYEGNPLLCGPPLNNDCNKTHFASLPTYPFKEENEDEGFMDMTFFWVTYTVTLFSLALALYINSYWRHVWFYYIEACFNTCYYFVVD